MRRPGFDETIYKLDLPNASDDLIDTGLMLMRETGGELTIDPAAVDRERGIILSERRARDTYQLRSLIDQLDFQMKGMKVANRIPVGTEEVIKTAPPARLRDLYERYYRPERATLVMVGDFDPAAVEAKIKARFSDWKGRGPAGADPDIGDIDYKRAAAADDFIDPAIQDSVTVAAFKPGSSSPIPRRSARAVWPKMSAKRSSIADWQRSRSTRIRRSWRAISATPADGRSSIRLRSVRSPRKARGKRR
jgi:zinc protease